MINTHVVFGVHVVVAGVDEERHRVPEVLALDHAVPDEVPQLLDLLPELGHAGRRIERDGAADGEVEAGVVDAVVPVVVRVGRGRLAAAQDLGEEVRLHEAVGEAAGGLPAVRRVGHAERGAPGAGGHAELGVRVGVARVGEVVPEHQQLLGLGVVTSRGAIMTAAVAPPLGRNAAAAGHRSGLRHTAGACMVQHEKS